MVRAVVADLEQHPELRERERRGLDRWDEMWEGVVHMVPPAGGGHQRFGSDLVAELRPLARAKGLLISYETGVWRVDDDYRIPDVSVYGPERASKRGIDGPPLVAFEFRSPGDETDQKVGWYLDLGVTELIVVDRDRRGAECHTASGVTRVPFRSAVLDVTFTTVGGQLALVLASGTTVVLPTD